MAKSTKKTVAKKATGKKAATKKAAPILAAEVPAAAKAATKKTPAKKGRTKAAPAKKLKVSTVKKRLAKGMLPASLLSMPIPPAEGSGAEVLDRLFGVIAARKGADPAVSHSARLLARGTAKVAQKFGEEAVECLIEAVAGNRDALIGESADVLYHLLVLWMDAGVTPHEVWAELQRREGVSGIAEKAARPQKLAMALRLGTSKIP
jgi:phosphoribosyl-ATP pyrophosphohydrolase